MFPFFCFSAGERLPAQRHQRSVHQNVSDAQRKRGGDCKRGRTVDPAGTPETWIPPLK